MDLSKNISLFPEEIVIRKKVRMTALILLILTLIWIFLTGKSMSQVKPTWTIIEYLQWVSNPDIFFVLNYINITFVTFFAIVLFFFLYQFLSLKNSTLPMLGLIFIPIYGVLNIVCYSIQISIVPSIAKEAIESSNNINFAIQFVQAKNDTLVGYINGLAYVILGIPSILYGYLLLKELIKLSGYALLISGVFSILGLIGYFIGNKILSSGMMIGGIAFAFALLLMTVEFRNKK